MYEAIRYKVEGVEPRLVHLACPDRMTHWSLIQCHKNVDVAFIVPFHFTGPLTSTIDIENPFPYHVLINSYVGVLPPLSIELCGSPILYYNYSSCQKKI